MSKRPLWTDDEIRRLVEIGRCHLGHVLDVRISYPDPNTRYKESFCPTCERVGGPLIIALPLD